MPAQLSMLGAGNAGSVPTAPVSSGLLAWYDASQEGYANNAAVPTLTDWSAYVSGDLTAAGAAQPTFKTAQQNGKPAILFNGTANVLALATFTPTLSDGMTIMLVASRTGGSSFATMVSARKTDVSIINEVRSSTNAAYTEFAGMTGSGLATDTTNQVPGQGFKILTGRRTDSSGKNYFSIYPFAAVEASESGTTTVQTLSVGARGAALYFAGYIAEVLIYSRPLTDGEIVSNQLYLKNKYAL